MTTTTQGEGRRGPDEHENEHNGATGSNGKEMTMTTSGWRRRLGENDDDGEDDEQDNHQGEEDGDEDENGGENGKDNGGRHQHSSTPNHRREQLLAGWKRGAMGMVRGPR
jgi:hypothetical protein